MESENSFWGNRELMGAGFIFQKGNVEELIVESEMWTERYVIFQIPIRKNKIENYETSYWNQSYVYTSSYFFGGRSIMGSFLI